LAKVIPIEEVIKANKKAGQFWFSPATLEFFQSQVSPWAVKKNSKAYFISGTFDYYDLAAIVLGAIAACLIMFNTIPRRDSHAIK